MAYIVVGTEEHSQRIRRRKQNREVKLTDEELLPQEGYHMTNRKST